MKSALRSHWGWLSKPLARRAVLWSWLTSFAAGWLVATPLGNQLSSALANQPSGDQVLFEPGGLLLLTLLSEESRALLAGLYASLDLLLVALPLWLFASALLFVALSEEPNEARGFGAAMGKAVALLPRLALLWLVTRVTQGLCVGLLLLTSATSWQALDYLIDERTEGLLNLGAALVGAGLALVLQLASLLVAAELCLGGRLLTSFASGYRALRARPSLLLAWSGYELLAALLHVGASLALEAWPGAPSAFGAALVHQLSMLGSIALQATATALAVARMREWGDGQQEAESLRLNRRAGANPA